MTYYEIISPEFPEEGYGIKIITERIVKGISPDVNIVRRLCDMCNRLSLSEEHFDDVLENYLADYETF